MIDKKFFEFFCSSHSPRYVFNYNSFIDKSQGKILMTIKKVSERLLKIRTDKGFTQQKFSEMLDVGQSFLSEIESAKTLPGLSFFISIHKKLNMPQAVYYYFIFKKQPRCSDQNSNTCQYHKVFI